MPAGACNAQRSGTDGINDGRTRPPRLDCLHAYVRLIKFRYHLSYATVVFGAVIFPGTGFAGSAGSLALLHLLFNVLLYGGIYTLNDVADLESDRLHPSKRRRPIASGAISEEAAVSFALLLILEALGGAAWAFDPVLAWKFAGFMGINACYSYFAQNVPVLDLAFVETADRHFLVLYQRPSARQRCSGTLREPLSAHSSPYTMEAGREDERHAVP